MPYVCRTLLLSCLGLLAGCVVTTFSAEPLGEAIAILKPEEWNGVWITMRGELYRALVVDSADGKLLVVEDWRDCAPKMTAGGTNHMVQVRQSGSWYFGNPAKKEVLYDIDQALRRDGEALYVCDVDKERVRELVVKGALPGFTYEQDVVVWPLSHDQYQVLLSDEQPAFKCGPPGREVFMRLPAGLDPCRKPD